MFVSLIITLLFAVSVAISFDIPKQCGKLLEISFDHDGLQRTTNLYFPTILCDETAFTQFIIEDSDLTIFNPQTQQINYPIILALHYLGGAGSEQIFKYKKYSESLGLIIVAPNGGSKASGIKSSWNADYCCDPSVFNGIDDVSYLYYIIKTVIQKEIAAIFPFLRFDSTHTPVPKSDILVTGYSNGGFMSDKLGWLAVSEQFPYLHGISPMAGYSYEPFQDYIKEDQRSHYGMNVFLHHSISDVTVGYNGCCNIKKGTILGTDCWDGIKVTSDCVGVRDEFQKWFEWNHCSYNSAKLRGNDKNSENSENSNETGNKNDENSDEINKNNENSNENEKNGINSDKNEASSDNNGINAKNSINSIDSNEKNDRNSDENVVLSSDELFDALAVSYKMPNEHNMRCAKVGATGDDFECDGLVQLCLYEHTEHGSWSHLYNDKSGRDGFANVAMTMEFFMQSVCEGNGGKWTDIVYDDEKESNQNKRHIYHMLTESSESDSSSEDYTDNSGNSEDNSVNFMRQCECPEESDQIGPFCMTSKETFSNNDAKIGQNNEKNGLNSVKNNENDGNNDENEENSGNLAENIESMMSVQNGQNAGDNMDAAAQSQILRDNNEKYFNNKDINDNDNNNNDLGLGSGDIGGDDSDLTPDGKNRLSNVGSIHKYEHLSKHARAKKIPNIVKNKSYYSWITIVLIVTCVVSILFFISRLKWFQSKFTFRRKYERVSGIGDEYTSDENNKNKINNITNNNNNAKQRSNRMDTQSNTSQNELNNSNNNNNQGAAVAFGRNNEFKYFRPVDGAVFTIE